MEEEVAAPRGALRRCRVQPQPQPLLLRRLGRPLGLLLGFLGLLMALRRLPLLLRRLLLLPARFRWCCRCRLLPVRCRHWQRLGGLRLLLQGAHCSVGAADARPPSAVATGSESRSGGAAARKANARCRHAACPGGGQFYTRNNDCRCPPVLGLAAMLHGDAWRAFLVQLSSSFGCSSCSCRSGGRQQSQLHFPAAKNGLLMR